MFSLLLFYYFFCCVFNWYKHTLSYHRSFFSIAIEHKEKIEKAEEKERLQKEKEEKEKKEAEEAQRKKSKDAEEVSSQGKPLESTNDDHIGLLEDSPSDKVKLVFG